MLRGNHAPNWSHDGKLLITHGPGIAATGGLLSTNGVNGIGYADAFVNIWDVFGAAPVYQLKETIYSLAFAPDERQLLSNGVTWDVVNARDSIELRTTAQTSPADASALAAVNQLWATRSGGEDVLLRLWKIAPDRREIVLEAADYSALRPDLKGRLSASPWRLAITPDGRLLTTISVINETTISTVNEYVTGQYLHSTGDVVVELWDLEKKTRVSILNEEWHLATGASADISRDGRLLATASTGGVAGISIRDLFTGKEIRLIQSPAAWSALLKFSSDGNLLFAADSWSREGDGGRIFAYEVATGRRVGEWKGHRLGVSSLAMSADGAMLAAGGNDRVIYLWDIRTGRKLASWEAHQAVVSALAITRDGRTLVSGGTDGALKLWHLNFIRKELSSIGLGW